MDRIKIMVYQRAESADIHAFLSQNGCTLVDTILHDIPVTLKKHKFDMCILDLASIADKFTAITYVKDLAPDMPILLVPTECEQRDIIKAYSLGIDDAMQRPYDIVEMLCRVRAVVSRTKNKHDVKSEFEIGSFVFYTRNDTLVREGETHNLTAKESAVLKMLCSYEGDIVQRKHVLKSLWGDDTYFNARSLDVYITKLRNRFKVDPSIKLINLRGQGFRLYTEN